MKGRALEFNDKQIFFRIPKLTINVSVKRRVKKRSLAIEHSKLNKKIKDTFRHSSKTMMKLQRDRLTLDRSLSPKKNL